MADHVTVLGRDCVRGIDVSRWQGFIDWVKVATGRDFAYMKSSGGDGGLYADGSYYGNKARSAGLLATGAYHFLGAGVSGVAQAHKMLEVTNGYEGHDLPPVVDFEMAGTTTRVCQDFLDTIDANISRRWEGPNGHPVSAMPYTGASMAGVVARTWSIYDLWLAAYLSNTYPNPGPDVTQTGDPGRYVPRAAWSTWNVWQWAGEDGRCPGIAGACDQNVGTTEWFTRTLGVAPPTPNPPTGDISMADAASLEQQINALAAEVHAIPITIGGYEQDSRRYEGVQLLKLPDGPEQYVVTIKDGAPAKHHVTGPEKSLLQLAGLVRTVPLPTGPGTTVDFVEVHDDLADALRALPDA